MTSAFSSMLALQSLLPELLTCCKQFHRSIIFKLAIAAVHYAVLVEDHAALDQLADDLFRLELGGLLVDAW